MYSSNELNVESNEVPAYKSGEGVAHPTENLVEKKQLNLLEQKKKSSVRSDSKLKKKIIKKKEVKDTYVPPELNPYLILNISLLYMVAADGIIRDEELSILQSVTGADKSIINESLKYSQNIKLPDFFDIAPRYLNKKEKLCILLNILDLMLIDGNTAEEELDYFFKLQEVFGFTDELIKPYLSILKLKNNKKALGPYEPQYSNAKELTPHTIFGVALIYMLSSDGIVSENEVGQLQSNLSHFEGLYDASSEYVLYNSVEQFLWDVRSKLDVQQSIFVLINVYDLLCSDGIIDENEKILFERFLAALSFDKKKFASFANLIEIKTNKLTTQISDEAVNTIKALKVKANPVEKKSAADSNHLREINFDEKAEITKGGVKKVDASVQHSLSSKSASEQSISAAVQKNHPGENFDQKEKEENIQKGREGTSAANIQKGNESANSANIQKGKEGVKSDNIQLADSISNLKTELQVTIATPSISSTDVEESISSITSDIAPQVEDSKNQNIQTVDALSLNPNIQTANNKSNLDNHKEDAVESTNEREPLIPVNTNNSLASNKQVLGTSDIDANKQKLANTIGVLNRQDIANNESDINHQPIDDSNDISPNNQALNDSSTSKNGEKPPKDVYSNQNLAQLTPGGIKTNNAQLDSYDPVNDNLADIPANNFKDNLNNIDSNSTTSVGRNKGLSAPSLQERFANITAEIDDLNIRLDMLLGLDSSASIPLEPEQTATAKIPTNSSSATSKDKLQLDDESNPLALELDSTPLNQLPLPVESEPQNTVVVQSPEVKPRGKVNAVEEGMNSNDVPLSDRPIVKSEAGIPVNNYKDNFDRSNPEQIVANNQPSASPVLENNINPIEIDFKISNNSATFDLSDELLTLNHPIPFIENTGEIPLGKYRKDIANESLSVFNAPNQIILQTNVPTPFLGSSNIDSSLFGQVKDYGVLTSEVFADNEVENSLDAQSLYKQLNGSRFQIPFNSLRRGRFKKSVLNVVKVSLTVALFGVWSFDYLAPCAGESCSSPQTGAPLLIKPGTTSLFHTAFAALSSGIRQQS